MTTSGEGFKTEKMPGHWVLARLGKRVLRPGGMELTRRMLNALQISPKDDVVEFAPGLGITAQLTLRAFPASYTAVERDEAAAKIVRGYLKGDSQKCIVGTATDTGLPSESASVVYGEAMLTMQPSETKRQIIHEANRLLKKHGRYGIHEMCLLETDMSDEMRKKTERELTGVVHHGVRPLTVNEWRSLVESGGFTIQSVNRAAMSLLEPGRLVRDEGVFGALRFFSNVLRDSEARRRVLEMRSVFRRNRKNLGAVAIIAIKN
jgi:ubiquinone/menaquinone biosynthesis C-methylase UbiE